MLHSLSELGDRIDSRRLEQLGVLRLDALDPEQVDMVDPAEDQRFADTRFRRELARPSRVAPRSRRCWSVSTPTALSFPA